MKKHTLKLLALLLACLMLLPLIMACAKDDNPTEPTKNETPKEPTEAEKFAAMSESEKAFYILELDDKESERMGGGLRLVLQNCKYQGYWIDVISDSEFVEIDTADKYFDYQDTEITTTIKGSSYGIVSKTETVITSGWTDGKHFQHVYVSDSGQSVTQNNYMLQTKEDYIADKEEAEKENAENAGISSEFDIKRENCATVTCTQGENGAWVATFTDIDEEGMAELKAVIKSFEEFFSLDDISDAVITLTVSSDFEPVSLSVKYEFSSTQKPHLMLSCSYTFGEDVVEPEIDLTDYTRYQALTANNVKAKATEQQKPRRFQPLRGFSTAGCTLTTKSMLTYSLKYCIM